MSQTLDAIEKVQSAAGKSESDVVFGGLEEQLAKLVDTMEAMQKQQNKQDAGQGSPEQQNKRAETSVTRAWCPCGSKRSPRVPSE